MLNLTSVYKCVDLIYKCPHLTRHFSTAFKSNSECSRLEQRAGISHLICRGRHGGTDNDRIKGVGELSAGGEGGSYLTCCWWRKAGSLVLRPTKRLAVGVPGAE